MRKWGHCCFSWPWPWWRISIAIKGNEIGQVPGASREATEWKVAFQTPVCRLEHDSTGNSCFLARVHEVSFSSWASYTGKDIEGLLKSMGWNPRHDPSLLWKLLSCCIYLSVAVIKGFIWGLWFWRISVHDGRAQTGMRQQAVFELTSQTTIRRPES